MRIEGHESVCENTIEIERTLISSSQGCHLSEALLGRVNRLRNALLEIERSLQERHLACCVFPRIEHAQVIISALLHLSSRRTGALIAVERDMKLDDYLESGTLLNAELSTSLLVSLFYPGNPLHDGAVVIRADSILAAGCIFPLSADHNTFKTFGLGTRHRAGVGVSQISDAIVFILSEETGKVSFAVGGQLHLGIPLERDPQIFKL